MGIATYTNATKPTQREQADPRQRENNAGGFTFVLDDWARLDRFLVLGTEGGTYYCKERALTKGALDTVGRCIAADGCRTVARIVEISEAGRAPKNTPAIAALALACGSPDVEVRRAAHASIPKVCRIGTHLFELVAMLREQHRSGGGLYRAITRWYTDRTPEDLAYQVLKYQQREKWSHRDVLRLTRGRGAPELSREHDAIFRWIVRGFDGFGERTVERKIGHGGTYESARDALPPLLDAYAEMCDEHTELGRACELITEHRLTHEMVPARFQGERDAWAALLPHMPIGAMVRQLGRMTANGLLVPLGEAARTVAHKLDDDGVLRRARLHPLAVLTALSTYRSGHGLKGKLTWNPVPIVADALDAAFYKSFSMVEPTGKRTLLALDVSGSMAWESSRIAGSPLTAREASAAMAMVTARTEPQHYLMGFSRGFVPLDITPRQRLDDVIHAVERLPCSSTDCAVPMLWASATGTDVDTFVVYTDNETWAGAEHPHVALQRYRQQTGIAAKLIVVGMVATEFTIADPTDTGMLDVVGFDTAAPGLIADFSRGGEKVA